MATSQKPTTRPAPRMYKVLAGTPASRCKGRAMGGTCDAVVYWIEDPQSGAWRIIDCDVEGGERPSEARDNSQIDAFAKTIDVHPGRGVDHHSNCPDVDLFRRGKR